MSVCCGADSMVYVDAMLVSSVNMLLDCMNSFK